jgi:hypothetical protein
VKARGGWDKPSTIERDRVHQSLDANPPRDLKQTTFSQASRKMLSSVGSSPEKIQMLGETKHDDLGQSFSSTAKVSTMSQGTPTAFPKSSSQLPPRVRKASNTPKMKEGSSLFPPQAKVAPTSVSFQGPGTMNDPAIGNDHPLSAKNLGASSISFGNMQGLGDSLFDAGRRSNKDKVELAPVTSSGISTEEQPANPNEQKDYKAMLTAILKKGNPSKLGSIDAALQKHKVRWWMGVGDAVRSFLYCNDLTSSFMKYAHLL